MVGDTGFALPLHSAGCGFSRRAGSLAEGLAVLALRGRSAPAVPDLQISVSRLNVGVLAYDKAPTSVW